MNGETVGLWKIHCFELDSRFHQGRHEGDIAGEPVELGNYPFSTVDPARRERFRGLGAIFALAAFHFRELSDDTPGTAVQVTEDSLLLCLKAQTRSALPLRRNTVISDEFACVCGSHAFRS